MIEHSDQVMMRRCVVVLVACALLFGCTSTPSAEGGSDSSPLAEAIGYDPMNDIFPRRRFAEIEAECIRSRGFAVDLDLPSPTTVPEELFLGSIFEIEPGDTSGEPYREFQASLSAAERATFGDALSECNQAALTEVYGSPDGAYPAALTAALNEMYARVRSDPRSQKVMGAFSECMADRGFADGYDSPNAVGDDLQEKADEIVEMLNENNELKPTDPRVAEMLEFERSIVSANDECEDLTDFDSVLSEVALEVQAEYLEEHPDFAQQVFGDASAATPDS